MNPKTSMEEFNLNKIWKEHEDEGIYRLNLIYNPETENLIVGCGLDNDQYKEVKQGKIDPVDFSIILSCILGDPFFEDKTQKIYIEIGTFRNFI